MSSAGTEILVLDQEEVAELLPMDACIGAVEEAFRAIAAGAQAPLRSILWLPGRAGALGLMPAYLPAGRAGEPAAVGVKAVTYFPANEGTPRDTHQGAVLLYGADDGRLLAAVDATEITAIRTAAASALATRLLARRNTAILALVGAGVQARTHLAAMLAVRPISRVRVAARHLEEARRLAERAAERYGVRAEACAGVREAVEGADVVCTVTSAREPVVRGEWLSPGAHVNAVGSSTASARELDAASVARARLYVDRRESALAEAGDFLLARAEGAVGDDHIVAELAELLEGKAPGRRSDSEITLFKSVGLAIEDVAAARCAYLRAKERGRGVLVPFGGLRKG